MCVGSVLSLTQYQIIIINNILNHKDMSEFLREHVSFQRGFAIFSFGYQKLTVITPNYNCKKFPHSEKKTFAFA